MSAASSAATQVRRPVAPTRTAPPAAAARPAMQQASVVLVHTDHEDEFRLNLSDIPRMQESMEVEGMRPTLLSRLFDLVAPLKP